MSSKRNVSTQTLPNHTVERTSSLCITPNCLRTSSNSTRKPTFSLLKLTCAQNIDYNLQLLPTLCHLSEEDMEKMDIWRQFGFSHIEPEPITKLRQFNKSKFSSTNYYYLYCYLILDETGFIRISALRIRESVFHPIQHSRSSQPATTWIANTIDFYIKLASLRQKLTMEKRELQSLEIAAIDMAFRSLIKNLLLERYPLIFSFNFQEKLQSATKYIPTISKSITRIIKNSPNVEFRSQAIELVKKTRTHVNLSFSSYRGIKEGPDLTTNQTRNILGNGLYTIARDTNVPSPPVIQQLSSEEEISDNRIMSRDIIKLGKHPDLNYNSKDTCNVPEVDFEMILDDEDGDNLFTGEKTLDVEDESMFENEGDNNQNLIDEEFEYSSSSENYEDFWDEEEIQFHFGTSNPASSASMDLYKDYKPESSEKGISHEKFNIVDDIDSLDFGTPDEEMHEYSNLDNSEGSSSLAKRYVSNNFFPYSRPVSPFRDKTITLLQGQESIDFKNFFQKSTLYSNEKIQVSKETFFDQIFDEWS
ncbi:15286_t:CDS:2 [Funneliformis caledonium]|uniref:15286_t:CDS:1 n=1 Tax=Funneliformis caledonium TaxID=1117310 RepID=A0A9N9BW65_9GLOM|nr:15286_t:CDS:2 [Funneliformis caledonium]